MAAGISFEVVPGVSSAIAAAELAGIPVTHRGVAAAFVVVSGHAPSAYEQVLTTLAPQSATVVVLMGLASAGNIAAMLAAHGWKPATPAAIIRGASTEGAELWTWNARRTRVRGGAERERPARDHRDRRGRARRRDAGGPRDGIGAGRRARFRRGQVGRRARRAAAGAEWGRGAPALRQAQGALSSAEGRERRRKGVRGTKSPGLVGGKRWLQPKIETHWDGRGCRSPKRRTSTNSSTCSAGSSGVRSDPTNGARSGSCAALTASVRPPMRRCCA